MVFHILLVMMLLFPASAFAGEYRLFLGDDAKGQEAMAAFGDVPRFREALRMRPVELLPLVRQEDGLQDGDTLVLPLFTGQRFEAVVDRVARDVNGVVTVRARLVDSPGGYLLLVSGEGGSQGSIVVPGQGARFAIVPAPEGKGHYLLEIDPARRDVLQESPAVIPPESGAGSQAPQSRGELPADTAPATIDVMVIYTPAAKQWADDNGGGIDMVITQAMEAGQLAHDNSNTVVTLRLVHSAQVSYTESGSSSTDLSRLQGTGDGHMDEVHTWRDTYGADVVAMFTMINDTGGLGYLLGSTNGSPAYAFSITRVQQAGWTYTTVHEIGHNMGLHHHKQQNVQPGPGLFSYSAGWRWIGNDSGAYCSIMTYESGQYFNDGVTHSRVAYFSAPGISYQGVATGDAQDGDNARSVREIKHVMAAYRDAAAPAGGGFSPAIMELLLDGS